ncbi:hypothetical protein SHAL103562_18905 [Shewanella algae]
MNFYSLFEACYSFDFSRQRALVTSSRCLMTTLEEALKDELLQFCKNSVA